MNDLESARSMLRGRRAQVLSSLEVARGQLTIRHLAAEAFRVIQPDLHTLRRAATTGIKTQTKTLPVLAAMLMTGAGWFFGRRKKPVTRVRGKTRTKIAK